MYECYVSATNSMSPTGWDMNLPVIDSNGDGSSSRESKRLGGFGLGPGFRSMGAEPMIGTAMDDVVLRRGATATL